MADKHSLEGRKLELRYQFRFRLIDLASRAIDQGIPALMAVLMVYFGIFRTAHELAGRTTMAAFGMKLFADAKPDELVSYIAAVVGWLFGINAQRLRRNTTERLTRRIHELEKHIDPTRTTSGLTERGQTPKEVD